MPPQRTASMQRTVPPVKAVKSERTHEENQERAYIAASRRSDRSLEARVESARRASEIHKRRTGRALRVTETDVMNEEMYEEEDDDFPHSFRNLNMLMMGGPFDRRMAAYYQHQIQMKHIVDRALQDQMAQRTGSMAASSYPVFSNSYMPAQQQNVYFPTRNSAQMQQSLHRQQPYPPPSVMQSHGRSMSMHIPNSNHAVSPSASITPVSMSSAARGFTNDANHHVELQRTFRNERHASLPTTLSPGSIHSQTPLLHNTTPQQHEPVSNPLSTPAFTDQQQLISPTSEEDTSESYLNLFPFTSTLPPESSRFFMGQMHGGDPNYEVQGDLFKPSNILLSPSNSPSKDGDELKASDVQVMKAVDSSNNAVSELGWQRPAEKFQPVSPNEEAPRVAGVDLYEDCWKPIQDTGSVLEQTPSDSSQNPWNDTFSPADFLDQDIWGTCIDQEWLESNVT